MEHKTPDLSKLPEQEKYDPSKYPPQKDHCKRKGDIGCPCPKKRPMLPEGVALLSLPVAERKKYMWMIPDELKEHQMYKEDDYCDRIKKENADKKQREEDDKKKKESDKDDAIQMLLKHVTDLTNQVNELTKTIKNK